MHPRTRLARSASLHLPDSTQHHHFQACYNPFRTPSCTLVVPLTATRAASLVHPYGIPCCSPFCTSCCTPCCSPVAPLRHSLLHPCCTPAALLCPCCSPVAPPWRCLLHPLICINRTHCWGCLHFSVFRSCKQHTTQPAASDVTLCHFSCRFWQVSMADAAVHWACLVCRCHGNDVAVIPGPCRELSAH